jgi:hypothetical protein
VATFGAWDHSKCEKHRSVLCNSPPSPSPSFSLCCWPRSLLITILKVELIGWYSHQVVNKGLARDSRGYDQHIIIRTSFHIQIYFLMNSGLCRQNMGIPSCVQFSALYNSWALCSVRFSNLKFGIMKIRQINGLFV